MTITPETSNLFQDLGMCVEKLWAEADYDEVAFSDVAIRALENFPPNEHMSFHDAVMFGLFTNPLPAHQDVKSPFGQPPLTVFNGRDFHIELLFWIDGLPAIHEHGFSGAFHVLSGSSLHTLWSFRPIKRIVTRLILGDLTLAGAEVLETGTNRPILAGNRLIHSTFHLERPSVSCVVRTNSEPNHQPQYAYFPPTIAFAGLDLPDTVERRRQLLQMLLNAGRWDEYFTAMYHLLEQSDSYSAFQFLWDMFAQIPEGAERTSIVAAARCRHKELTEVALPAFQEHERLTRVSQLRQSISNPDLQYFLALLLNLPAREPILKLVRLRYSSRDPVDIVISWVKELSIVAAMPWLQAKDTLSMLHRSLSQKGEHGNNNADFQPDASSCDSEPFGGGELVHVYWLLKPLFLSSKDQIGKRS